MCHRMVFVFFLHCLEWGCCFRGPGCPNSPPASCSSDVLYNFCFSVHGPSFSRSFHRSTHLRRCSNLSAKEPNDLHDPYSHAPDVHFICRQVPYICAPLSSRRQSPHHILLVEGCHQAFQMVPCPCVCSQFHRAFAFTWGRIVWPCLKSMAKTASSCLACMRLCQCGSLSFTGASILHYASYMCDGAGQALEAFGGTSAHRLFRFDGCVYAVSVHETQFCVCGRLCWSHYLVIRVHAVLSSLS
mmetsp:Transcript_11055/g.18081  ORF Transcript_11055/g.18081 Transcript_11055/m.18081 type:complete len:243 (+) Transcript_11055:786-1514(+)